MPSEPAAPTEDEALQAKVQELEERLVSQGQKHATELKGLQDELGSLVQFAEKLEKEAVGGGDGNGIVNSDVFTRRVEWAIDDFLEKEQAMEKWQSIWSPKFKAAGMQDLQLEFFPRGREKTSFDGFCSLFLWCPSGTKIKYQLRVGSFLRAPDEDEYSGRIGHGHSNFCPLDPEVDRENNSLTVGVEFLEVIQSVEVCGKGLRLISTPLDQMVAQQAEMIYNRNVAKVVWKITNVRDRVARLQRGSSMWSKLFTAAGIRDMLLEFYPNGSANTTKDGWCAFYIRCPEGVSMIVTLMVGSVKKGPIKTTFDSLTGKGLPDFCLLEDQIVDDCVEVGIELQNQPLKTLTLLD